jgi:hypothetical protein
VLPAKRLRAFELTLACVEILAALYLTFLSIGSLETIFSSSQPYSDAAGWSAFGLLVTAPLTAALWISGVTMFRSSIRRWFYQLLPPAAVTCAAAYLFVYIR